MKTSKFITLAAMVAFVFKNAVKRNFNFHSFISTEVKFIFPI